MGHSIFFPSILVLEVFAFVSLLSFDCGVVFFIKVYEWTKLGSIICNVGSRGPILVGEVVWGFQH